MHEDKKSIMEFRERFERAEKQKRRARRQGWPFLLALGILTVVAWMLPLRPTVSTKEKRTLETFPAFSLAAVADGSYFSDISLWFSDTFPGRDGWILAAQRLEKLYGDTSIAIYGNASAGDKIPVAAEKTPAPEPSADAVPAAAPEEITVPEESAAPTATAEPTPTVEPTATPEPEWGGENPEDEEVAFSAVIQIGDSAYDYAGFSQYYADAYAANVTRAADLLEGKCRVFDVFRLHGTTLLLPRDYREEIGVACEEDALTYVNSQMGENVYCVDTFTPLLLHNSEYIYFRTDHHWTALGAWYAYEEWAKMAGFEPVTLDRYEEIMQEPFLGSFYYKAHQSSALTPDQVYGYVPPGDVHLYINPDNNDSHTYRGYEQPLITKIRGTDKYLCFLTGDFPLCTFVNNDITDGSACLLIKDSNGNPFGYYLTQHYQYVYVMDYRKYVNRSLTKFVNYYDVDDVIFCMSSDQAQSRGGNSILSGFIR